MESGGSLTSYAVVGIHYATPIVGPNEGGMPQSGVRISLCFGDLQMEDGCLGARAIYLWNLVLGVQIFVGSWSLG